MIGCKVGSSLDGFILQLRLLSWRMSSMDENNGMVVNTSMLFGRGGPFHWATLNPPT